MPTRSQRLLIVDLNNFARYPTIAVGYLVAALRRGGFEVEVLSPLAHRVESLPRERVESAWDDLERRIAYSTSAAIGPPRRVLGAARTWWRSRAMRRLRAPLLRAIDGRPSAVLVSTYLDARDTCAEIASIAKERGIPVLVGGPAFNHPRIADAWRGMTGVDAIVGGEAEPYVCALVDDLLSGADVSKHPGTTLPDGRRGPPAPPLADLDALPFPDYVDFPWHTYPSRVVPVLTGRGCGWAACTFCADVVTANGRTYRSRSIGSVLEEMARQRELHSTSSFALLDIKANSNLELWEGLAARLPSRIPDARWIATVHVGRKGRNGLSPSELRRAREAGCVRLTFGLESGSQRLLERMDKGTDLDGCSRFARDAHAAGISVRTTVIQGYPGEDADDLAATARFLEEHADCLDRVRLNRFNALPGTRFEREYEREPARYPGLEDLVFDFRYGSSRYRYRPSETRPYRRAIARVCAAVHAINRRPLKRAARDFDGLL